MWGIFLSTFGQIFSKGEMPKATEIKSVSGISNKHVEDGEHFVSSYIHSDISARKKRCSFNINSVYSIKTEHKKEGN